MAREKILVIDDEEDILELVRYNLAKEGYSMEGVTSGEEALAGVKAWLPDLILLDLMLPGVDGLDLCRQLKSDIKTAHIPIIMLTARSEDVDIVLGLELGAEDYITKPFSPRVLIARIRAVLRRGRQEAGDNTGLLTARDLVIHVPSHQVLVRGKQVDLTATEFEILCFLSRRPGWVFTRNQIINGIKGDGYAITDRSIDVQIVGLRRKLGSGGKYIETVRGVGYRLME
jgi:two-component system alkaline phosphatase synthesis response regulator PhoP